MPQYIIVKRRVNKPDHLWWHMWNGTPNTNRDEVEATCRQLNTEEDREFWEYHVAAIEV